MIFPFTILVVLLTVLPQIRSQCSIPEEYRKLLYAREEGKERNIEIKEKEMIVQEITYKLLCKKIYAVDEKLKSSIKNIKIEFESDSSAATKCTQCYQFMHVSGNILRYRHSGCLSDADERCLANDLREGTDYYVGFVNVKGKKPDYFNCKSIIEGIFHFTYRIGTFTGVCDNPANMVRACQVQGSPLRDNNIFTMNFGYCPGFIPAKFARADLLKYIPFKFTWTCMGQWVHRDGSLVSGIRFNTPDTPYAFRCLKTSMNQRTRDNLQMWGLSNDANCGPLLSKNVQDEAFIRLDMWPAFEQATQTPALVPGCKLPTNFSGNYFYPGDFTTSARINSTHIYFKRNLNQFRYEQTYFVCKQSMESRYLMATVTRGKCYVDYVCFYFLARHGNIIGFRMSRPYRQLPKDTAQFAAQAQSRAGEDLSMQLLFRQACSWNSFTLNYVDWTYERLILTPPVPVNCPIQGRFLFTQTGQPSQHYRTNIPGGMTPRPRMQVRCYSGWQSDLAACWENPKQYRLDVRRCMRLNHLGRPISEYDTTDNVLTCVGFWMEDTKSYLITYDPMDPVNQGFRCWVYKRIGFNQYVMSRSSSGSCNKIQTAESSMPEQGASLRLELTNNELEFDSCPMKFNDGTDPGNNRAVFEVFSGAPRHSPSRLSDRLLLLVVAAVMVVVTV